MGGGLTQDYVLATYPFGVGVALVALSNSRCLRIPTFANLGPLVLGIYASHYLFIDLLKPVDDLNAGNPVWELEYVAVVFLLSLATTWALSRFSLTRRFVT